MILDFKEIPQANSFDGRQDTFELFARDFLEEMGYEILSEPCRGSDGKKDLIVGERRSGIGGTTNLKWLVSCKHYAFSGKSVTDTDEPDISDRIKKHKCSGFMGFYSTIPSTSLSKKLEDLDMLEHIVYDRGKIEKKLLESPACRELARRYFSNSMEKYFNNNPTPIKLYKNEAIIKCDFCGENLIKKGNGIWVGLEKRNRPKNATKYIMFDSYFSCKGSCDFTLREYYNERRINAQGWLDIDHFKNPLRFLSEVLQYIDRGQSFELDEKAREKMKLLIRATFPFVARILTDKEKDYFDLFYDD